MGPRGGQPQAEAVFCLAQAVHRLRRGQGRRQDLGGTHQGPAGRLQLPGDTHTGDAAHVPGAAVQPHRADDKADQARAGQLQRHAAHDLFRERQRESTSGTGPGRRASWSTTVRSTTGSSWTRRRSSPGGHSSSWAGCCAASTTFPSACM